MDLLGAPALLAFVCAIVFYKAGAQEARLGGTDHGVLWASFSILLSALIGMLHGTWLWLLIAQIALFFGIGVCRALREP